MANRTTTETYIKQNLTTTQPTTVPPTTVAAVTVTDSYITIDTPSGGEIG